MAGKKLRARHVPLGRVPMAPPKGYSTVSTGDRTYWSPVNPGETLEGTLVGKIDDKDPQGKPRQRWTLLKDGDPNTLFILPDHWSLVTALDKCGAGTKVWIGYEGREKVKGIPSPMARYVVAIP